MKYNIIGNNISNGHFVTIAYLVGNSPGEITQTKTRTSEGPEFLE